MYTEYINVYGNKRQQQTGTKINGGRTRRRWQEGH